VAAVHENGFAILYTTDANCLRVARIRRHQAR